MTQKDEKNPRDPSGVSFFTLPPAFANLINSIVVVVYRCVDAVKDLVQEIIDWREAEKAWSQRQTDMFPSKQERERRREQKLTNKHRAHQVKMQTHKRAWARKGRRRGSARLY